MDDASQPTDEGLGNSFIRVLLEDVLAAQKRRNDNDTPAHRRDMIRAVFAAIEGAIWIYRKEVREAAATIGVLTPLADLALREKTFSITARGEILEQVRYVSLPTTLRLLTAQARHVAPSIELDMSGSGWRDLDAALEVRHRITHPKSLVDMAVDARSVELAEDRGVWTIGTQRSACASPSRGTPAACRTRGRPYRW